MAMINKIPKPIIDIIHKLEAAGFEAFVVGGCVRDLLMDIEPKDWDVTTNAKPEEITKIFPDSFYENKFGTVGVKVEPVFPIITKAIKIDKGKKKEAIEIAKKYLANIKCPIHGLRHAENVAKNIREIAKDYKEVSLDALELAGYFHDSGRSVEDDNHAKHGGKIIKNELAKIFDEATVDTISKLVGDHHDTAKSLEQKIIQEADAIDGIAEWRVKGALRADVKKHIEWIENDFSEVLSSLMFRKSLNLIKPEVIKANKLLGISLHVPSSPKVEIMEVTTYRIESKYSDKRHPDEVRFAKTLEEDLSRRDFTVNALALRANFSKVRPFPSSSKALGIPEGRTLKNSEYEVIDLFGGRDDLKNKIIRAVGDPNERFDEDALRMMRAVRFAITLANGSEVKQIGANSGPRKLAEKTPFVIEEKTKKAIAKNAKNLKYIALERIQDELNKILVSDYAAEGIELLRELKLLQYIIPELEKGYGMGQNRHHIYTIYEHSILSLKNCPSPKLEVRLATLLHDIAKPETKRGEGAYSTFYNHDHVGARVAERILKRLKYSSDIIRKVKLLVDNHMFYYNVDEVGASSVRRLVKKVGLENIDDLIDLRIGDRLGSGVPKAVPYKLRHFKYMVDRISKDPLSVKMLKVNGNDLMKGLKLQPGPKIGAILDVLLSETMDELLKNEKSDLLTRAKELMEENLPKLREMAKEKIEERKEEEDKEIKAKYWVK
jgi:poly(A) polymerase/tRNA nucleotidyltransferase (CCA-adding enzyme)